MKIKKGTLLHVLWVDAEVSNEWTEEKDLHDHSSLECESVGFLVSGPTKSVPIYVIAGTRSKENKTYEYNAISKIPSGWVKEVKQLGNS